MNKKTLGELLLYRYRYAIGYLLLVALTLGLLTLNITTLPPGLSKGEEASAVASNQIALDGTFLQTVQAVNLPYHLLQKASLHLFGLGTLGVRLPTVLLAGLSAYFLFLILRRWFQQNVAIVMGVLIAASSWFLSFGRLGTPDIMVVFDTTLVIFLATLISQETKHYLAWKALIVACVGLSLYTPYMAYIFLAALIATYTQPHLRYLIRYDEKISFFLGLILFAAILVPLGWHVWREPAIVQTLLALPAMLPDPLHFLEGLGKALAGIIDPFHYALSESLTPLVSIPMAALGGLGLVRVVKDYHSVRSHVLLLWIAVLIPIIGLNPGDLTLLFVPVILLCAIGVQALFGYWYRLFPYNPYARIFGLLPLGILMLSVLQFSYQRYFVALPYSASIVQYDLDPLLLHGALASPGLRNQPITLVVPSEQIGLYNLNHDQFKNLTVLAPAALGPPTGATIVSETAYTQLTDAQRTTLVATPSLIVSDRKDDALRFRIFNNTK